MHLQDWAFSAEERLTVKTLAYGDCFRRLGRVFIKAQGDRTMGIINQPICMGVELETGAVEMLFENEPVERVCVTANTVGAKK